MPPLPLTPGCLWTIRALVAQPISSPTACDDSGPGSDYDDWELATDCDDCGPRCHIILPPNPSPPPSQPPPPHSLYRPITHHGNHRTARASLSATLDEAKYPTTTKSAAAADPTATIATERPTASTSPTPLSPPASPPPPPQPTQPGCVCFNTCGYPTTTSVTTVVLAQTTLYAA